VAIDVRASGPFLVAQTSQAELDVALPPDPHLIVMHADGAGDVPVGPAVGRQQHDARPLSRTRLMVLDRITASSWDRSPRLSFNRASRITPAKHMTVINARMHW
jgi:hypothetical protein